MVACAAVFGQHAAAQSTTRWTAPSGLWSIDFAAAGWTYANPVPDELRHFALIMIPLVPPPDNEVRFCMVSEVPEPREDQSDEDVRLGAARIDQSTAARLFPSEEVSSVSLANVNGVNIADVRGARNGTVLRHRLFALPIEGQILSVQIDCAWPAALDAATAAEAGVILDSVAINGAPQ